MFGGPLTDASKNRIGYLPEERGLYKSVSVIEVMTYLGKLKGLSSADAKQRSMALLQKLDRLGCNLIVGTLSDNSNRKGGSGKAEAKYER